MRLIGWMFDIARDQSPSLDLLERLGEQTLAAGYNTWGLYLEHRYAYPSAPFAMAPGAVTPEMVRRLVSRFSPRGLRIVPFLNTLGHMEGFIRSEGGHYLAESDNVYSLQICPSRAECVNFARRLIADVLPDFDSELIHLGGDEAWELGNCPRCAERAKSIGKAGLYAEHFGPLCRWVLEQGRRPGLWGDMLLKHPEAMSHIPKETLIFDWQYFGRPAESTRRFREAGFEVVCCPSVQTYNSGWCFLDATQRNIDEHAEDARALGAEGVLLTTWEFTFFSHYAAIYPLIFAAGLRLSRGRDWVEAIRELGGETYAEIADILGRQIPAASEFLRPGTWRSLRDRLVIRQNPFELWKAWRKEACSSAGDEILRMCEHAVERMGRCDSPHARELWLPVWLHHLGLHWVREIEAAYTEYSRHKLPEAAQRISQATRERFARLRFELRRIADEGGSRADVHRVERLLAEIASVTRRIWELDREVNWLPSFETIVHANYARGDQAAWRTGEAAKATD